jgi:hypothetical protein
MQLIEHFYGLFNRVNEKLRRNNISIYEKHPLINGLLIYVAPQAYYKSLV